MKQLLALLTLILIVIGGYILFITKDTSSSMEDSTQHNTEKLSLTSPAFSHNSTIPSQYTCDGENVSPPLSISGVPEGTQSLVLIMDDPDIPQVFKDQRGVDSFDHWTLYGLSPDTTEIPEGFSGGATGLNGRGDTAYTGPCPPPEYEPTEHRYIFKLYALSGVLNFIQAPTKAEVESALQDMIIEQAELIGLYDRAQ